MTKISFIPCCPCPCEFPPRRSGRMAAEQLLKNMRAARLSRLESPMSHHFSCLASKEVDWQDRRMATETLERTREVDPLVVHTSPVIEMDDKKFFQFCQINRDLRIERNAQGDILIMAPAGGSSGHGEARLIGMFFPWAKRRDLERFLGHRPVSNFRTRLCEPRMSPGSGGSVSTC